MSPAKLMDAISHQQEQTFFFKPLREDTFIVPVRAFAFSHQDGIGVQLSASLNLDCLSFFLCSVFKIAEVKYLYSLD